MKTITTTLRKVAVFPLLWIPLIITITGCKKNTTWSLTADDTNLVICIDPVKKLCIFELINPVNSHNWTKSPSGFTLVERVDMENSV